MTKMFADRGGKIYAGPDCAATRNFGIGLHQEMELLVFRENPTNPLSKLEVGKSNIQLRKLVFLELLDFQQSAAARRAGSCWQSNIWREAAAGPPSRPPAEAWKHHKGLPVPGVFPGVFFAFTEEVGLLGITERRQA